MSLPTTTSPAVGRAIRAARERSGIPITRVARESALTASELTAIEAGRSRPSVAVLQRIAQALGSSLVDLVRGGEANSGRNSAERDGVPSSAPSRLGLSQIARAIADLPVTNGSKLDAAEAAVILYAMTACHDNQSAAARLLSMERKAFVRRLRRARRRAGRAGR